MALFKHANTLTKNDSDEFDKIHNPGSPAPFSGIYRCMGCSFEVASNEGQPLPPHNHHHHKVPNVAVRWKLAVYAEHLK